MIQAQSVTPGMTVVEGRKRHRVEDRSERGCMVCLFFDGFWHYFTRTALVTIP